MKLVSSNTELQEYFRTAYGMYFADLIYMGLPTQEYIEGQAILRDHFELPVEIPMTEELRQQTPITIPPFNMSIVTCEERYDMDRDTTALYVGFACEEVGNDVYDAILIDNIVSFTMDKRKLLASYKDYVLRYGTVAFDRVYA